MPNRHTTEPDYGQPHNERRSWRKRAVASVAGILAVSACTSSTAPVSELSRLPEMPDLTVIAAGDSYAAGTGTSPWNTGECARGEGSPAELVAQALTAHFENIACAGRTVAGMAETQNDEPSQLEQLATINADLISLSVGANSVIDFRAMADYCSNPANDCGPGSSQYEAIRTMLDDPNFLTSLEGLYGQILDESPNSTLIVNEYPVMLRASLVCSALAYVLADKLGVKEARLADARNAWLVSEVTKQLNDQIREAVVQLRTSRQDLAERIVIAPAPDMAICGGSPDVSPNFVAWYQAGLSDRAIGHPNASGNVKISEKLATRIRWDSLVTPKG